MRVCTTCRILHQAEIYHAHERGPRDKTLEIFNYTCKLEALAGNYRVLLKWRLTYNFSICGLSFRSPADYAGITRRKYITVIVGEAGIYY